MGEETETHTSEESDYELQQSISSSSDRKKLHWSVVNEDGWKWWWGNGYGTQAAKSLGQHQPVWKIHLLTNPHKDCLRAFQNFQISTLGLDISM